MTICLFKATIQIMEAIPKAAKTYKTLEGKKPFTEWFRALKDSKGKVAIVDRIDRAKLGNLGNYEPVGEGVLELKIFVGPGYRVYIGLDGQELVILLCGGDKSTQARKDIELALKYWADYKAQKELERELEKGE